MSRNLLEPVSIANHCQEVYVTHTKLQHQDVLCIRTGVSYNRYAIGGKDAVADKSPLSSQIHALVYQVKVQD